MKTLVVYTDGGCSGNGQRRLSLRRMVAVVTDDRGTVLVEKEEAGGSNNVAEFLAVKEAMVYAVAHGYRALLIRSDSSNNKAWYYGRQPGANLNDRDTVLTLKAAVEACKASLDFHTLVWVPRGRNLAGLYLDAKKRRPRTG